MMLNLLKTQSNWGAYRTSWAVISFVEAWVSVIARSISSLARNVHFFVPVSMISFAVCFGWVNFCVVLQAEHSPMCMLVGLMHLYTASKFFTPETVTSCKCSSWVSSSEVVGSGMFSTSQDRKWWNLGHSHVFPIFCFSLTLEDILATFTTSLTLWANLAWRHENRNSRHTRTFPTATWSYYNIMRMLVFRE